MLKGSIMQMKCPECDACYYLLGDFIAEEGQFVRAASNHWAACSKCTVIHFELFLEEE